MRAQAIRVFELNGVGRATRVKKNRQFIWKLTFRILLTSLCALNQSKLTTYFQ